MTQFEKIYTENFSGVYRYVYKLSGDEHIAEDITSETFFRALKSIDGFRSECSIKTWLIRIAKNLYMSYLKENGKTDLPGDSVFDSFYADGPSPEESAVMSSEYKDARIALHSVPEPYREVFMWRAICSLPFSEIGAMFGKSADWACVTYHRAKNMLKQKLEENDSE